MKSLAASKTEDLALAHSGLGLVYFRRQQYDDSAKELKQATQAASTPDPSDLYVLGIDLQTLKQNPEAADAFDRCAQNPGPLPGRMQTPLRRAQADEVAGRSLNSSRRQTRRSPRAPMDERRAPGTGTASSAIISFIPSILITLSPTGRTGRTRSTQTTSGSSSWAIACSAWSRVKRSIGLFRTGMRGSFPRDWLVW